MDKKIFRLSILLVLICIFDLAAQRQDSGLPIPKSTERTEWSDLIASMDKMHTAMSSVYVSGDGDADFVRLMLPHHQAAIDMAKTQLTYGTDPQIRRLAQEIVTDQQSEIELMQLWLKERQAKPQN